MYSDFRILDKSVQFGFPFLRQLDPNDSRGADFKVLFGRYSGVQIGKVFLEKLGSDVVV